MEREQREAKLAAEAAEHTERTSRMALSAIEQGREALRAGNTPEAIRCGLEAMELNADYSAQGQLLLSDALGIYDLFDGFKAYRQLQLDSQPMKVVLSPQGTRIAAATIENALVFDTDSGDELARLRSEHSALSDIAFLGEDMLLFAGTDGLCAYNLAQGEKAWTAGPATGITVSMDGATVAAVYKNENIATIYDAATGTAKYAVAFENDYQSKVENDVFADPENNLLALDDHGTKFAASFADGSLRVFDLADSANDLIIYDTSEFTHFEGGFFDKYLAFSAAGKECSVFAIIDTMEGRQTGGFASTMPFYVQTDKNGIYVSTENILVQIDPETGEQREVAYTDADIIKFQVGASHTIVTTTDQSFSIYDAAARLVEKYSDGIQRDFTQIAGSYAAVASLDAPTVQLLKLKEHEDSQLFSYAPDYQHSEARLSSDMQTVMLFRYDKFRLYDMNGNVLADVELPDAKEVYDQQYRRSAEGDYLEVTYNDGTIRSYSAEDGRLTCEEAGNAHDGSFEEEFLTEHLRVISPLHGTPLAYDRASGELICELEKDDYLTYVTEVEEYVITEYLTAQGERYGLLLNRQCETLARLPGLCDILADGTLVFDNMAGDLRQSRIYSKQELIALAQNEEG